MGGKARKRPIKKSEWDEAKETTLRVPGHVLSLKVVKEDGSPVDPTGLVLGISSLRQTKPGAPIEVVLLIQPS